MFLLITITPCSVLITGLYYPKGDGMRRYETIFIIDPEISDENRDLLFDRLRNIILQHDGFLVMFDEWGTRKLAYEIKKRARGYYLRLDYCGTGTLVDEIERFSRIDDRILKYMSVLLEKDVDLERLKEEAALAEAEKDEPDQIDVEEYEKDKPDQDEPDQIDVSDTDPSAYDPPESEEVIDDVTQSESNEEEE